MKADRLYELILTADQRRQLSNGALEFVQSGDGIRAILRSSGGPSKFVANVPLKGVNPQTASALVSIPLQASLNAIEDRLKTIEEGITSILRGQHSDRLAEVRAGIEMFQCALSIGDFSLRRQMVGKACAQLILGRSLLLTFMDRELREMKELDRQGGFWTDVRGKGKANEVTKRLVPLQENVLGAVMATRFAVNGFTLLGEEKAAVQVVEQIQQALQANRLNVSRLSELILIGAGGVQRQQEIFWSESFPKQVNELSIGQKELSVLSAPAVLKFEGRKLLDSFEGEE